jgi:hypothetical protein
LWNNGAFFAGNGTSTVNWSAPPQNTENKWYRCELLVRIAAGEVRQQDALYLTRRAIGKVIHRTGVIQLRAASQVQEAEGRLKSALEFFREHRGNVRLFEEDLRRPCTWYTSSVDLRVAMGSCCGNRGDGMMPGSCGPPSWKDIPPM